MSALKSVHPSKAAVVTDVAEICIRAPHPEVRPHDSYAIARWSQNA
jgi:hypothetical protein